MAAVLAYARSMFQWTVKTEGIIAPDERPPAAQTIALGVQHIFAMFGATVLAPVIMGFNPQTAILFSGIGTLIFFVCVRGRVPSYLGSSFSFIAVVLSAEAITWSGTGPNIPAALGGIIACGALYAVIGLVVMAIGYKWVEFLMPPVVTGAVVAVIGLNLAPAAINYMIGSGKTADNFGILVGLLTALVIAIVAVYAPGMLKRLPILVGGVFGYVLYFVLSNVLNVGGTHINFDAITSQALIGMPVLTAPTFDSHAITLMLPVAIVLVAENLGHVKAVAAMTGKDLDPYIGRAFFADGLATMVAGSGGGTGVTTYAENIGVMAVTKIYSSIVFVIAACVAIVLGFSPMFGALVLSIPGPVLGGMAVVLFGLIATTGIRICVENKVDFTDNKNFITMAVALTLGAGNLAITQGDFSMGGIGTACIAAILAYQILNKFGMGKKEEAPAS
jgi:putative pyrimidine permease RutG